MGTGGLYFVTSNESFAQNHSHLAGTHHNIINIRITVSATAYRQFFDDFFALRPLTDDEPKKNAIVSFPVDRKTYVWINQFLRVGCSRIGETADGLFPLSGVLAWCTAGDTQRAHCSKSTTVTTVSAGGGFSC